MIPALPGKVSVVLASRDGARYLPQALASIAAQTLPPHEVLLVDDGSRDGTSALLEAFAREHAHARVLRANGVGPAAARALAAREASGELLSIHDDDDVSRPERFERQAAFLAAHPDIGLVGSAATRIDESGRELGLESFPSDDASLRARLRRAPPFVHGSVTMRREAYERAGGYRAAFRVAEDYDLYLRVANVTRFANLAEPLYAWRAHAGNTYARRRDEHLFYAAVARAFAWERASRGADSVDALSAAASPEAFLRDYAYAPRLACHWGELLVRQGWTAEARRVLTRGFADAGVAAGAAAWWLASWPVQLTPRARRGKAAA
jgi:glycosyltransferase involved in cell wall biosynthesis